MSGAILARIPTDPCTQAGGAALPVRVTRIPCLPYHSGRRKETSEDGAHMPLLLSSMALPFRREQPELIDDPRQKLFRSDGCSSDRIAPSWCQVAGLPAIYRARRISRGPTRESGTAPTVRIRHMPPRDLNRATCRCNAARRKASLFLLEWTPTRPSTQRPLRKARTETAVRKRNVAETSAQEWPLAALPNYNAARQLPDLDLNCSCLVSCVSVVET